jgi:hypothetical protein
VHADRSTSRDRRGLVHRDLRTSGTLPTQPLSAFQVADATSGPVSGLRGRLTRAFHPPAPPQRLQCAHATGTGPARRRARRKLAAAVASPTPRPVLMVLDQGLFASRQHRRHQTSWIHQTKNPTDPQRARDAYKPHTARRKRPRVRHQRRRGRPGNPPRPRSSHGAPSDRRRPRPGVPGPAIDHTCVLPGTPSQLLARPFRPSTAPRRLDRRQGVVSRTRCRALWRDRQRIPAERHPPPNGTVRPNSGEQGQ